MLILNRFSERFYESSRSGDRPRLGSAELVRARIYGDTSRPRPAAGHVERGAVMNDISVLYAGKQMYSESVGFVKHSHSHWEIFYFVAGKRRIELDDAVYFAEGGQWILVRPDVEHTIPAAKSGLDVYIIKFEVFSGLLRQILMTLPEVIGSGDKMILTSIKRLAEEERSASLYSDRISSALLEYLLFEFARRAGQGADTAPPVAVAPLGNEFQNGVVNMIVRYIQSNYQHEICIRGISRAIGYSESYCCTVFKQVTRHTIMDYLNLQRVHSAEELIVQNTDLPLTEIAERVGYKNFSHFSKVFKQILHTTPSRVRELAKKEVYEDTKRIGFSPWLYDDKK